MRKRFLSNGWTSLRKLYYFGFLGLLPATESFAQGLSQVNAELGKVTEKLRTTIANGISVVQVLVGILAVVALIALVAKFKGGVLEAKKKQMMWVGGLVVSFIVISIVKTLISVK